MKKAFLFLVWILVVMPPAGLRELTLRKTVADEDSFYGYPINTMLSPYLCLGWCPGSRQAAIAAGLGRGLTLKEVSHEPDGQDGVMGLGWILRW